MCRALVAAREHLIEPAGLLRVRQNMRSELPGHLVHGQPQSHCRLQVANFSPAKASSCLLRGLIPRETAVLSGGIYWLYELFCGRGIYVH